MFLVLGLPRSRTFWLSKLLSYGDFECGHEEARYLRTIEDAKIWLNQDYRGSAETSIAPFWRLANELNPNLKIVVVRRPPHDVIKSLLALDLRGVGAFDPFALARQMLRLDAKLQQIAQRMPNVLSIDYAALDNEETIARIFTHCLPYKFDREWWLRFRDVNLQCHMRAMMRYAIAYREPLTRLAETAKFLCRAQIVAKPVPDMQGMTIQQEPFEDWIRDGVQLFAEHLVKVGERPDDWKRKNLPLMQKLYDAGAMQITTARCNGRMFGYLAAFLNPSLEAMDSLAGLHTTFYASPDVPGLGLKLQRASVAALRAKGAKEVIFHAGVRGDGPRMGVLYKRLGAQEFGSVYRLQFAGE